MAKMRPSILPDDVLNEPFRKAEINFYEACKILPDNWFVLYGVSWYLHVRNLSWNEGEADFVIVSPETGLVVIEVKGGRIGRDSEGWYSIDRYDKKHSIHNPSQQASNCKYNLMRYIQESSQFSEIQIPARHMVCFPDITESDAPQLPELPREMQILSEDFSNLAEHIRSFSARNYDSPGSTNHRLTPSECSKIVEILKPNFDCPNRWSTQAAKQNAIMDNLTDNQAYLWDIIEDNNRLSLSGPAGSGKTILALKLIKKTVDDSKTVLALLPGIPLKQYYKASVSSDLLHVESYSSLYSNEDYNDTENTDNTLYSLIVIDEAQDISEDGWLALYDKYRIKDANKLLCIFDSNQRLNSSGRSCPLEQLIPLRLSKVLRNTRQIGLFSSQFYDGQTSFNIIGPDGTAVQYSELESNESLANTILELVRHYVFKEKFEYSDIVVLSGSGVKSKVIHQLNDGNDLGVSFRSAKTYTTSYCHNDPFIVFDSVYRYRGLESKIVILIEIDDLTPEIQDNVCYVGSSRARNVLHIIATRHTINRIK